MVMAKSKTRFFVHVFILKPPSLEITLILELHISTSFSITSPGNFFLLSAHFAFFIAKTISDLFKDLRMPFWLVGQADAEMWLFILWKPQDKIQTSLIVPEGYEINTLKITNVKC
jgi:hypothetical protein